MDTNQPTHDEGDDRLAGDLLVGADAMRAFLVLARHARENRRSLLLEAERQLADRQHRRRRRENRRLASAGSSATSRRSRAAPTAA